MGDNAMMSWLFIGSLKGISFAWLCTLPVGFIKFWADLEAWFLTHFYEDDIEVSMHIHIEEKQRKGKFVKNIIERFKNLFLRSPESIPLSMLL